MAREAPTKCTKCGGAKLEQVTDVLDTWFSSGLLPFTTLGWPEKTRDQAVFYPTTLLITAYEILFFWVARMIMFGCHFMQGHEQDPAIKKASGWGDKKNDSVPFRQVYIHALVRDADRQKMSKTKGNVIDPLEIIERFGTDATRFTLAAMAAPGTDIAFNESRTDGYRAFANKIWNAARFMFMNVDRIEPGLRPGTGSETRSHTSTATAGVAGFQTATSRRSLDSFALQPRCGRRERCARDLSLPRSGEPHLRFFLGRILRLVSGTDQAAAEFRRGRRQDRGASGLREPGQSVRRSLRLLHPVMPFITEEIWQAIYEGKPPLKSIALAAYPQADEKQFDLAAETEMAILQDLIVSVRNLRAELKVEPKVKVPIEVFAHEPAIRKMIEQNHGAVERLGNVEKITFVETSLANRAGARGTARFDVHVIYERKIDVAAECERLKKELEKIEKELANNQKQLGKRAVSGQGSGESGRRPAQARAGTPGPAREDEEQAERIRMLNQSGRSRPGSSEARWVLPRA